MKTIKDCFAVSCAVLAAAFVPASATTVKDAKWGNVGNATDGGIAEGVDNIKSTQAWTLDFGDSDCMATTEIGGAGVVRISRVTFAARANNELLPTMLIIGQGETVITNSTLDTAGTIAIYNAKKEEVATRKACVFTFDDGVLFDTAEPLALSFGGANTGMSVVRPSNPTFRFDGNWSPVIEIVGDYVERQELDPMYRNRLSTGDAVIPAGKYGEIAVPEKGFRATAFDTATKLPNTASGEEIVGSYADIIKDGTYIDTHTVAGWFNVNELPTDATIKAIYFAQSHDADHAGYQVAVDAKGNLLVGKVDYANGRLSWNGTPISTAEAVVAEKAWFHLAVANTKTANAKSVTTKIFVNGKVVALDAETFAGNLNGNGCSAFNIGAGISAAGIYVDKAALDDARAVVQVALEVPKPYEPAPPTPTLPDADFTYVPKVNASPTGWITSFAGKEPFTAAGQFRIGPDGECVSVVSSGQHPWSGLAARTDYTMALYADVSRVTPSGNGSFLIELGTKSGTSQGLVVKSDGNVALFGASNAAIGSMSVATANAPAAGYHLFVWTKSATGGAVLYVDGERVGTDVTIAANPSAGFQLGSMHAGAFGGYAQAYGMAVAGVYGWDQVLNEAQVELLSEQCPPILGGIEATGVSPSISGTLNLVDGDSISNGTYACSIAVAYGATVDLKYDGVVQEGAQILSAASISAEGATFTVNGESLPKGLEFDVSGGRIVIGKPKVTKLLNPYAVKNGDVLKVSCNTEAAAGEAAKAYDGNASTYFAPGDAANAKGVSWTGIEFTNGVIVTEIVFTGNYARRMIGGAFQGANLADYSDATNIYVVESYSGGTVNVELPEAKGPYKYLRFMGMYGGNVSEIAYYGLADSGAAAPTNAPSVTGWSDNGVANVRVTADETIPQLFIVQRAMRNFCDPDGSDYETCVTLAPQPGATTTWIDGEATGYALYRMQGRNANGESGWTYFEIEPEKLIAGPIAPTFGGNGPGFYASEAVVTIDYPVANAKIYYTLDGSTPTTNSLPYADGIALRDVCAQDNPLSQIMTNPKELTNNIAYGWRKPNGDQPNVNVIRARAFLSDGSASTNEIAGTWMIGPTVSEHLTNGLRVVSVITDRENYFGDPKGIMVPGDIYNGRGWVSGQVGQPNANYFQRGAAWERPAFVEMFDEKGVEMFSNKMGTRVHGNWSRASAKKTLVCYSRKELGSKNIKLDKKKFRMFNDEPDHNKYKRIMLRNGGNDWYKACLRDAVGQSMFRGYVNTGTQGYEPTAMYVNGEYWGVYNLRHAYSKQHFEEWNGAVEDDIDYVKLDPDSGDHFEVQEGDFTAMWNIMQYMITCTKDGVMDDAEYAVVSNQVDIADMIDFHIVNIFLCNADWIKNGNNMGYWRNRSGDDRKWHFTVYDCDSAMAFDGNSYASSDKLSDALNVNDTDDTAGKMAPGFLKRCFMNDGFKKRFANRFADLLNTALRVERTTNIVAQAVARIEPEIGRTAARWTNMESYSKWKERLATFRAFFVNRPGYQWDQIKSRCNGGDYANITLAACDGKGKVKVNTIESGTHFDLPFTGQYFTAIPVTLMATPDSGSEFAGWKIGEEIISTEPTIELMPTDGVTVQAVFEEAGASDQEKYLRLWGFCGVPDATKTDEGEFVIFTNFNQTASLDASGADIRFEKAGEVKDRCFFSLPEDTVIAPGGWVRINQADIKWEKITNGKLDITLRSSDAVVIYGTNTLDQTGLGVDGTGYFAVYDFAEETWGKMLIADAPGHEEPEPPEPGGDVISGEFPDGLATNVTAGTVLRIGNATFGGPLTISGADATIELQAGTTATIPKIETKKALTIDGDGTLVMSNDTQLVTCAGLTVTNGTVKILYTGGVAESKAVELKGSYVQYGGTVTMVIASPGEVYGFWMDTKKIEVKILGGTFNTTIDGGAKSATFRLEKGSNNVTLGGGTVNVTLKGKAPRFVQTKAKIDLAGATVEIGGDAPNARVFKSVETLKVSGGVVTGEAAGDGSEVFSSDDDIKVTGGVVSVTAADDCFSAATNIVISAGKVQVLSTAGDAIDSNGDVTISGGYVLANTLAEGELGIEADGKFIVSGGSVVAVGYENMIRLPDAGSVACYTNGVVKYDKDNKYVEVAGTNDAHKTILTVNLKDKCAKKFSLVATCQGFVGTVSYTGTKPDKDLDYIEKLDDNIDGAFITTLDIVVPGKGKEMEAKTEEEAQEEIKKYEVQLTQEDVDAGVPKEALKMEVAAVTNGTGEVTGYKAVVAVNPEVVEAPSVGEGAGGEPIVVTPGEGGTEVSVGIVNATMGLWYGYEVCNALGDGFANDVPSFSRATGESITVTGSRREGASSFFRVKVLPARPTK